MSKSLTNRELSAFLIGMHFARPHIRDAKSLADLDNQILALTSIMCHEGLTPDDNTEVILEFQDWLKEHNLVVLLN